MRDSLVEIGRGKYYTDWVAELEPHEKLMHDKDVYEMQDWVWNHKEDLDSFIMNYIDVDETSYGGMFALQMANRWFAIALLAHALEWDY